MDRPEGGRRRQKRLREYEAQESEEEQRILKRSARTVSEGCLMVRDERPDPDHLRSKLPQEAEVIAVGPGGLVDGNEVEMTVEVGDKVITGKYSGTQVKVDGMEYTIVRQNDILAVVED